MAGQAVLTKILPAIYANIYICVTNPWEYLQNNAMQPVSAQIGLFSETVMQYLGNAGVNMMTKASTFI